jgi:hypothetical protein
LFSSIFCYLKHRFYGNGMGQCSTDTSSLSSNLCFPSGLIFRVKLAIFCLKKKTVGFKNQLLFFLYGLFLFVCLVALGVELKAF